MRRFIGANLDRLLALVLVLGVWKALTLFYPPLVVPTISGVAAKFLGIAGSADNLRAVLLTACRLLAGLALGAGAGTVLGAALGRSVRLGNVFRPIIGLMQAVPPISWLVLALIWFGFNGRASVFIVAVSALPAMVISLVEGVGGVDRRLLEMGAVYRFSRWKMFRHIYLPSVLPHFRSGLRIAVGTGSKAVVMGEVLTTASGVGGAITDARLNLEPESVVAWTLAMVLLYFLLDRLSSLALRGPALGRKHAEGSQPDQKLREPEGS